MSYKISLFYCILIILIAIPIEAFNIAEADDFPPPPKEPKENLPFQTSYTSPAPLLPKRAIHGHPHSRVTGRAARKNKKYGHSFKGNEKYYASTLQPTKTYKYKGKFYYNNNAK